MDEPVARLLHRAGDWAGAVADTAALGYEDRMVRRRRIVCTGGLAFLADLPGTVSLAAGDALELDDGRVVRVDAAPEPLLRVTGDSLARLAWHIGNRHTPCQIADGFLLIRRDHVLEGMLRGLGAGVEPAEAPFLPEGGAYGHGRTMGHAHGPGGGHGDHDHDHHHHHHPAAAPSPGTSPTSYDLRRGPFGEPG
jgi:urease accessory protein